MSRSHATMPDARVDVPPELAAHRRTGQWRARGRRGHRCAGRRPSSVIASPVSVVAVQVGDHRLAAGEQGTGGERLGPPPVVANTVTAARSVSDWAPVAGSMAWWRAGLRGPICGSGCSRWRRRRGRSSVWHSGVPVGSARSMSMRHPSGSGAAPAAARSPPMLTRAPAAPLSRRRATAMSAARPLPMPPGSRAIPGGTVTVESVGVHDDLVHGARCGAVPGGRTVVDAWRRPCWWRSRWPRGSAGSWGRSGPGSGPRPPSWSRRA